jgi:hypothetical protein
VTWLQFVLDFGHCRFDIVSNFGFRASDFRVSGKWVKYDPKNHDLILPKSEAELLRHGTRGKEQITIYPDFADTADEEGFSEIAIDQKSLQS